MQARTAIGLMSGTSMDGIDLALIETDGEGFVRMGPTLSHDYDVDDRALLRQALADATSLTAREARPGCLAAAEQRLTSRHAELVRRFLAQERLAPADIDVIGFHGQTVLHRPHDALTVQLGDGGALAALTGVPVVADMRAADVAAGGQGAPLVPAYHRALVAGSGLSGAVAVLNLGGVANVTAFASNGDPIAFDTGPANALLDDLMLERTGHAMDREGALAAAGTVDEIALAALLDHPYFAAPPPKSLDRNAFSRRAVAALPTPDAAATLVAFTAASVALAVPHLPATPMTWIACGGGARNPSLMAALAARLPGTVVTADDVGWSAAFMEAQAFAYLAVRSLRGLPLTFPGTTGVARPISGGRLFTPDRSRGAA